MHLWRCRCLLFIALLSSATLPLTLSSSTSLYSEFLNPDMDHKLLARLLYWPESSVLAFSPWNPYRWFDWKYFFFLRSSVSSVSVITEHRQTQGADFDQSHHFSSELSFQPMTHKHFNQSGGKDLLSNNLIHTHQCTQTLGPVGWVCCPRTQCQHALEPLTLQYIGHPAPPTDLLRGMQFQVQSKCKRYSVKCKSRISHSFISVCTRADPNHTGRWL